MRVTRDLYRQISLISSDTPRLVASRISCGSLEINPRSVQTTTVRSDTLACCDGPKCNWPRVAENRIRFHSTAGHQSHEQQACGLLHRGTNSVYHATFFFGLRVTPLCRAHM